MRSEIEQKQESLAQIHRQQVDSLRVQLEDDKNECISSLQTELAAQYGLKSEDKSRQFEDRIEKLTSDHKKEIEELNGSGFPASISITHFWCF